jgi:hypothetical protein
MAYSNIKDPSAHFQAIGWTGNDVDGRALTNDGNSNLQPDLVWLKAEVGYNNFLTDSTRGTSVYLSSNTELADTTWTDLVESFDTNGFTIGDDGSQVPNHTGNIFAAWQWKAGGGTTASNSNGNITSTVQANTTAGFSIVTWTGDGSTSGKNVGHGLGAVPKMIISKDRDGTSNLPGWYVYHVGIGNEDHIQFTTNGKANSPTWGDTTPTSTVFSVGGEGVYIATNENSIDYIAYCFAEVQGYSKFGTYKGNGDPDGPFVYTGFKPAFILLKKSSDNGDNWMMYDHKRPGYNTTNKTYSPNSAGAEYTNANANLDILSNGFKLRSSFGAVNQNTHTYIYMAVAEQPLVANGIPTTAR